jgi:hypothetical protein
MNLEKFKYRREDDNYIIEGYIPNYNMEDDYIDASEFVKKSSIEFRLDQLKSFGYYLTVAETMVVDMDCNKSVIGSIMDLLPNMKSLINEYKKKESN